MNENARALRLHSTDVERKLWHALRNRQIAGHKFRRQHPVGAYIADFACIEANLIVEADGGQHVAQEAYDNKRDAFLKAHGFRVLRFWNNDILENFDGVLSAIHIELTQHPHPVPLPQAGEGTE